MKLQKRSGGFSLVECLVAAVILGIGIVGVAGMFAYANISERKAAYMARAREVAQQKLEEVRARGYAMFSTPSGSATVPTPELPNSTGVLAWQPYPNSGSEQGLKLVSLNLSWGRRGPTAGKLWATTLVSQQGGW